MEKPRNKIISFLHKKEKDYTPGTIAWSKFKSNPLSLGGLIYVFIIFLICILGYSITKDKSQYSNEQHLEIATKKPGFSCTFLYIRKDEIIEHKSLLHKIVFGYPSEFSKVPIQNYQISKDSVFCSEYSDYPEEEQFIKAYSLVETIYPLSFDSRPEYINEEVHFRDIHGNLIQKDLNELKEKFIKNHIKKETFFLGTDRFGRDLFSRLVIGARVSFSVGFISVFISLLIGITLGAIAGYFRSWIDDLIMWLISVIWSIPTLLLVIALSFALGRGFWQVFIAVGLTMWVEVARVVRGQVISLREKEFVEAGRALGYSNFRIISRHILPNLMGPVIVISAANFASAILIEAGLSFLGIGVQPPMPSWGTMIKDHYGYIIVDQAYLAILPGIAIMLMVLSFTLVGNGIRDAMDSRSN